MKKLIKISLHLFSLTVIAILVFFTNVVERITPVKKTARGISDDENALNIKKAKADIPSFGGGEENENNDDGGEGSGRKGGGGGGDDDCDEGGDDDDEDDC